MYSTLLPCRFFFGGMLISQLQVGIEVVIWLIGIFIPDYPALNSQVFCLLSNGCWRFTSTRSSMPLIKHSMTQIQRMTQTTLLAACLYWLATPSSVSASSRASFWHCQEPLPACKFSPAARNDVAATPLRSADVELQNTIALCAQ